MYKMYVDGVLFYDSTLENLQIESGTITHELNKAGSLKFSIYPTHPYYQQIHELKSLIEVYRDGVEQPIFRGRALSHDEDFFKRRSYTCEGHYNFLVDSIARTLNFVGTPAELFRRLVESHNTQVEEWKNFKVGNITVTGEQTTFTTSGAETTQNAIKKLLLDEYGGYVSARFSGGEWYLDYLEDFTERGNQAIEFGENLSQFTRKNDYSDVITALIPYGKDNITVSRVNDNSDVIKNEVGISLYGTIIGTENFSEITNANQLLAAGTDFLNEQVKNKIVLELNAVDMSLLDVNLDALKIETYCRIISEPHRLDDWFLITKQTVNLTDPTKDSIVLGGTFSTFTDQTSSTGNTVKTIDSGVSEVIKQASTIQNLTNHIGKSLFSGTFSRGSVSATGVDGFRLIAVTLEGFAAAVVCVNNGSNFNGANTLLTESGGTTGAVINLAVSTDTLTYINAGILSGSTLVQKAITSIYGVI